MKCENCMLLVSMLERAIGEIQAAVDILSDHGLAPKNIGRNIRDEWSAKIQEIRNDTSEAGGAEGGVHKEDTEGNQVSMEVSDDTNGKGEAT